MENDVHLSRADAALLQWQETQDGRLVMWIVTWNTSDYPRQAAARPNLIADGHGIAVGAVLLADSLDELRDALPDGLSKLDRDPNDDPGIVEVWL